MKYFLDNTLPPRFAPALNALMETPKSKLPSVVHLREKFVPNKPDIEWIEELANEGNWVIVSGDVRITRNAHERKAWKESKLTAFFLKGWSNQELWLQAASLIRWWPDIMQQAARVSPGAGFLVPFSYKGRFEQVRFD